MHLATRGHKLGRERHGDPRPGMHPGPRRPPGKHPGLWGCHPFKLADYLTCLNNNTTKARRAIPGEKCLRKQWGQGDCEHIHTQSSRTSGR